MNSSLKLKPILSDQSANGVGIYIRNYRKQASMITVQTPVKTSELVSVVAKKYHTAADRIALFLNGERLDQLEGTVDLKEKAIVHLVNLDRTAVKDLTVFFKFSGQQAAVLKVLTSSSTQIRSIFQNKIQPFFGKSQKEIFFAYLGRPINIFKTFQEELIENECEVMILEFKKAQLKHIEILNKSLSKHDISFASTKQLGMPMNGGRDRSTVMNNKQKAILINKGKPFQIKSTNLQADAAPSDLEKEEKGVAKLHSQKIEVDVASIEESAAPLLVYEGFDPHIQGSKPPKSQEKVSKAPTQLEKYQKQNPQAEFSLAPKDFLYMGASIMEETQQFSAGVVQDYKQNFLKKKSSGNSGKQNKK